MRLLGKPDQTELSQWAYYYRGVVWYARMGLRQRL